MTLALSNIPRWFSIDSDHDISADTVQVSLDQITWVSGTYGSPPQDILDQLAQTKPIEQGFLRYWWWVQTGPSNILQPGYGNNIFHGKLIDSSSVYYLRWRVYVPYD